MADRYTEYTDPSLIEAAEACARGCYQRALLAGTEAWSGSTLRGKAASYGGRYAASRRGLLRRLTEAGIQWREERREHGRRVVVIGAARSAGVAA